MIKKLLAISSVGLMIAACGEHDPSIALLETSASTTVQGSVQTQAVQMVIVADHTSSMKSVNDKLIKNIPSFVKQISTNDVEVFCTHAFNIDPTNELQESFSTKGLSQKALTSKIKKCLDYKTNLKTVGQLGNTDERGLESAVNAWKQIKASEKLNNDAIKVTIIATNEDDCSRDSGEKCDNYVIEQVESGIKSGYSNVAGLKSTSVIAADLNSFSSTGNHIFAPIVIKNDGTSEDSCRTRSIIEARKSCSKFGTCTKQEAIKNGLVPSNTEKAKLSEDEKQNLFEINALRVLSTGDRYENVASKMGQKSYCIVDNFSEIFNGITQEVVKIEGEPVIVLDREPENVEDIKITVTRTISDKVTASNVNLNEQNQWKPGKKKGTMVRTLSSDEIEYDADSKTISFKGAYTPGLNDSLSTNKFIPAKFDKRVNN